MKYTFCALALLTLPACMGGGGGADVTMNLTPDRPDAPMNASFGSLMNGVRMGIDPGLAPLTYDSRVGQAAQNHANDMFTRDYDSIFIPGTDNGSGAEQDIGDRVTAQGYRWDDIAQLIDKGERSLGDQVDAFSTELCDADGTTCFERPNFVDFGLAKAGSGADQRWVLILTEPTL
ncbi:CAP domain-containing protein [Yoonia sp. 2307UL14-13]|uniref:CAP domain-containing protein n=1 Tax=Yoonia sp. 2307UL14-13 TaxID=3126506 RepID=UPI0030B411D2